jgi:hypothetical protein
MCNLETEDILLVDFWDKEEMLEDLIVILDRTARDTAGLRFAFLFAERPEGQSASIISLLW